MSRTKSLSRRFAVLWIVCGLLLPSIALAEEAPLNVDEQRQILAALKELALARQEIEALRLAVQQAAVTLGLKDQQVELLLSVIERQERMLQYTSQVFALQDKAVKTYQAMAVSAEERARLAEERAERLQTLAWLGPIGMLIALIIGGAVGAAAF